MAQFQRHFVQDLTETISIRQCGDLGFTGDNLSDVISVDLYTDGVAYSGGGTCAGACICPDGSTVALTGSVSGKTASVSLTEDCFAIPGQIGIAIRVTTGTTKTTVLKAIYNVEPFSTDNPVDPGSRITLDVDTLINRIDAATADIPASDMASMMAGIAPTFSATTAYPAGAYVYYNGTLYRFTTAHAAGSWTGTDATAVALGNDVADLKSAFVNDEYTFGYSYDESVGGRILFDHETYVSGRLDNNGGVYADTDPHITTGFLRVRAGQILTLSSALTDYHHRIAEYSTDNVSGFIRNASTSSATSFTVPDDVKYIRFSFPASELTTAQLTTTAVLAPQLIEKLTNGGLPLTTVSSLDTIANSVMNADQTYGIYRYAASATSVPTVSSGAVLVYRAGAVYCTEFAMPVTGGIYTRYCENGTWSDWEQLTEPKTEIIDVGTSQTYATFTAAFNHAKQNPHVKFIVRLNGWYEMNSNTDDLSTDSMGQGLAIPKNVIKIVGVGRKNLNVINFVGTTQQSPFYLRYSVDIENIYFKCVSKYCLIIDDGTNHGQTFNVKGNQFKLTSGGSGCIGIGTHRCEINILDNYFEQGTDSGVRAHNWDYGASFAQNLNIIGNYFSDNMVCAIHLYTVNRYNSRGWARAIINGNEFNTRGIVLSEEDTATYGTGNLWEVWGNNNSAVTVTINHHDDADYTGCVQMFLPSATVTDNKIQ